MRTLEQAAAEYIARTPGTKIVENYLQMEDLEPLDLSSQEREQYAVALIAGLACARCIATGTKAPPHDQVQATVAQFISDALTGWVATGPLARKISLSETDLEKGHEDDVDVNILECLAVYHYRDNQKELERFAEASVASDEVIQLPTDMIEELRQREGRHGRGTLRVAVP